MIDPEYIDRHILKSHLAIDISHWTFTDDMLRKPTEAERKRYEHEEVENGI